MSTATTPPSAVYTDADLIERLEQLHYSESPTGRAPRSDKINRYREVYRCLERWSRAEQPRRRLEDRHRITWEQLALQMGKAGKQNRASLRNALQALQAAGVVRYGAHQSEAGAERTRGRSCAGGQYQCLWFELVPVGSGVVSPRSSVGYSSGGCGGRVRVWHRRVETRAERRARSVRPRVRRTGVGSGGRDAALFFSTGADLGTPGSAPVGGVPLGGSSPTGPTKEASTRGARPIGPIGRESSRWRIDASRAACPATAAAALMEIRREAANAVLGADTGDPWTSAGIEGTEGGEDDPTRRLLVWLWHNAGEWSAWPTTAVALIAWEITQRGRPPRLTRRAARRLEHAAGIHDRRHGAGSANRTVIHLLGDLWTTNGVDPSTGPVHSLGWIAHHLHTQVRPTRGTGKHRRRNHPPNHTKAKRR